MDVKKGETYSLLVGMQTGTATVEITVEVSQNPKNRTIM